MRLLLGAFGDPGHAFPMIALGRALRARGHDVTLQTAQQWEQVVRGEGLAFAAAPEYPVFPTREAPLKPYQAVLRATEDAQPLVEQCDPEIVVHDILTLAPALAAERAGVKVATLVPHVDPRTAPGAPPYSVGALPPRTAVGRKLWGTLRPATNRGLESGRAELNETRSRLGLPTLEHLHTGLSRQLTMVASFPALEYPRPAEPATEIIGPMIWEPPTEAVQLPAGDGPLVLVAPSTAQDPEHNLLRASIRGLGQLDGVRVLATWNRRPLTEPIELPANVTLVEWVSYAQTMRHCDVVINHGGHGTLARVLASGAVPVVVPAGGDQAENAARVAWAGAGVRVAPRLASPRAIRAATELALFEPSLRTTAQQFEEWYATHDSGLRAAELLEQLGAS
ncbi:MAG: glycosyl transferase [Solirubrobacteraceae bacterium]|jgi:UDP:flavonoid glycosyltransferase YjiC (YdhE family)|nr:glycosyl transferase [Solirubrobacteraceae bacterium]MDP4672895.1 glycosyl transferase [Solirubrobacteraceae bacterium]MDP4921105.1 glycosyl transferase [Solirubrobacteraceae bacterium]